MSFIDFAPTVFSLAGIDLPAYLEGQTFLGAQTAQEPRRYIHAAADRFDAETDTKRAVRDYRFKYIRNLRPERGYYLPVSYREQMATMQELLRLRDSGGLSEVQAQWFRASKPVEELFDTEADPHELHNLATDPAYTEKLAELGHELDVWMEATRDKGTMPEPDLVDSIWPGQVQPATAPPTGAVERGQLHLASATDGASIGYQIVDSDSSRRWHVYTEPVELANGARVRALAHRIGFAPSNVVELP